MLNIYIGIYIYVLLLTQLLQLFHTADITPFTDGISYEEYRLASADALYCSQLHVELPSGTVDEANYPP
jgi:hypothetical protein